MSMGSSSDINWARKQSVGVWRVQHHPPLEGRPAKYQLPEELWGHPPVVEQRPQREESEPLRMAELSLQPSPRGPSPSQAFREVALLGLRQSIPKVLLATSAQLWPGSRRQRLIPEALGQVRAPPAASTWAGAPGQLRGTELSSSRGLQEAAGAFRKQQLLRACASSMDLCSWGKPCWELISSCCRGRWDHHAWGTGGGRGTPFHELSFYPGSLSHGWNWVSRTQGPAPRERQRGALKTPVPLDLPRSSQGTGRPLAWLHSKGSLSL